jgi:hypothetical protein
MLIKTTIEEMFSWESEDGTIRWWHVGMAKEMIQYVELKIGRFPTAELTVTMAKDAMDHNRFAYGLNPERVAAANYDVPIIAVTLWDPKTEREEALIIDGWHRVAKFVSDAPEERTLKAYVLPKDVSEALEKDTAELMKGGAL